MSNSDSFFPDERDVMKYILADVYYRLEYNEERDRYYDSDSDIELTGEEYVVLQGALEKLGVTIY